MEAVADAQVKISQEEDRSASWRSDLEQTKAAVLNSLTSASGQRTYDHAIREFVAWYCSAPASPSTARLCSGTAFTWNNAGMRLSRLTFGSPRSGVWRTRHGGRHRCRRRQEVEVHQRDALSVRDKDSWQARTLPNVPQGDGERQAYLLDIVKKRGAAYPDILHFCARDVVT